MECIYLVQNHNRKSGSYIVSYIPNPAAQQQYEKSTIWLSQGRRNEVSNTEDVKLTP